MGSLYRHAIVLVILGLFALILRWPMLDVLIWDWDESIGLVVAQTWRNGGIPYRDAFDNKGPLFYLILRMFTAFDPLNIFVFRVVTSLYLAMTGFLVYLTSLRFRATSLSAINGALIYIIFMSYSMFDGGATNGEIVMLGPASIALWGFSLSLSSRSKDLMALGAFLLGLFASATFLIKTTGLFSVAPLCIFLLIHHLKRPSVWISALIGGLLPAIWVLLLFLKESALDDLEWGLVGFNYGYMHTVTWYGAFRNLYDYFLSNASGFLVVLMLVTFILWGTFLGLKRPTGERTYWYVLISLLIFSTVGAIWGRNAYGHYFLQLGLPIGLGVSMSFAFFEARFPGKGRLAAHLAFLGASLLSFSITRDFKTYKYWAEWRATGVREVVDFLKKNAEKGDDLFVLGGQPIIYYMSGIRPVSPNFFWCLYGGRFSSIMKQKDIEFGGRITEAKYFVWSDSLIHLFGADLSKIKADLAKSYNEVFREASYVVYKRKI